MASSGDIILKLKDIEKSLSGMGGLSREMAEITDKAVDKIIRRNEQWDKTLIAVAKSYKNGFSPVQTYFKQTLALNQGIKTLTKDIAKLMAEQKILAYQQDKLTKSAEEMSKGYLKWIDRAKGVASGGKQIASSFGKFGSLFGVQTLGFQTVTDKALKYRQSLFNLTRVQQVSGKGSKDMASALKIAEKEAFLAKDQFAGLASEVSNMRIGLAPANTEIANIAANMKNSYGPNIDLIIEKTKKFFEIQNEWPDIASEINKAQEAIKRGDHATAEEHRKTAELMAVAYKVPIGTMKEMSQMASASSKEQDALVKTNTQNAKTAATWGNLQIEVGEKMLKSMEMMSKQVENLGNELRKIPGYLAAVSGGMQIFSSLGGVIGGVGGILNAFNIDLSKTIRMFAQKRFLAGAGGAASSLGSSAGSIMGGGLRDASGKLPHLKPLKLDLKSAKDASTILSRGIVEGTRGATSSAASGAASGAGGKGLLMGLKALLFNPLGIAAVSAIGLTVAAKMYQKKTKKDLEETAQGSIFTSKMKKEMGGSNYRRLLSKVLGEGKDALGTKYDLSNAKEYNEVQTKIARLYRAERDTLQETAKVQENIAYNYMEDLNVQRHRLELLDSSVANMNKLVSLSSQYGIVNEEALSAQITLAKSAQKEVEKVNLTTLKYLYDIKTRSGLEMNVDFASTTMTSYEIIKKYIGEGNKLLQEGILTENQRLNLVNSIKFASEQLTINLEKQNQVIAAQVEQWTTGLKVANSINDVVESRLNAERQFKEMTMYGMGPSVEMMQKQVDLAYRRVRVNEEALQQMDEGIKKEFQLNKVSDKEIQQKIQIIKLSETDEDIKNNAKQIADETGVSEKTLIEYAKQFHQRTEDIYKEQTKIAEITKNVREGYISALKSMMQGASKFQKIVGTQERGTTQLIKLVERVTGKRYANTYMLGGFQTSRETQMGVGRTPAYHYQYGVRSLLSEQERVAREGRVWEPSPGSLRVGGGVTPAWQNNEKGQMADVLSRTGLGHNNLQRGMGRIAEQPINNVGIINTSSLLARSSDVESPVTRRLLESTEQTNKILEDLRDSGININAINGT